MHAITCTWTGDMSFDAVINGHTITLDAEEQFGGSDKGPRPKPLILTALAGCSGMDVVSMLKKMREPLSWFNMRVEGDLTAEHPKVYQTITLVYEFKKSDKLNPANVEKAVSLSQEKYCGVSAMLQKAATVRHEIVYLDD